MAPEDDVTTQEQVEEVTPEVESVDTPDVTSPEEPTDQPAESPPTPEEVSELRERAKKYDDLLPDYTRATQEASTEKQLREGYQQMIGNRSSITCLTPKPLKPS